MKVTFLGAAHEVTGSATLLTTDRYKILVDYGLEQGNNLYDNVDFPVDFPPIIETRLLLSFISSFGKSSSKNVILSITS